MERQTIMLWAIVLVAITLVSIGGNVMAVEHLSLITTPVILLKGDEQVSLGTGFYYILDNSSDGQILFLVTNYHVLTGHPPQETKPPIGDNIYTVSDPFRKNEKMRCYDFVVVILGICV